MPAPRVLCIAGTDPSGGAGLLADLVAAGEVAKAGAAIARMNVESNLSTLPDSEERSGMLRRMGVARTMGKRT